MTSEREFSKIPKWEKDFDKRFKGGVFYNHLGDLMYSVGVSEWALDDECDEKDSQEFWCEPLKYSDVERLMEKSLEVGEDLLLKECKDRPYDWEKREKEVNEIWRKRAKKTE